LASTVRIAEQQYTQALGLLQAARAEAAQKRTYLLTYVRPTLPTEPSYPNQWLSSAIVAGTALLTWAMITLVFYAVRDRA
jgi:capsular polysaccharide transport system permease protein